MASGQYRRLRWSQLRIGLAVTVTVLGISIAVFFIDAVKAALEDRYTLYFHTLTTQTLRPHAPVWLAGQRVGRVEQLRFQPPTSERKERLRVALSIRESARPYITEGAVAQVIQSGLLGEAVVNILPAEGSGEPLSEYAELPTARELDPMQLTNRIEQLIDSVAPVAERWERVLDEAREGDGTLARLAREPDRLDRWHAYVEELSAILEAMSSIASSFSGVIEDPQTRSSLERLGPRLDEVVRRWEEGGGTIGAFARDSLLEARMDRVAERIAAIEARLESGRGTAGRLLKDRALARELAETREMIRDLREDLASALLEGQPPP